MFNVVNHTVLLSIIWVRRRGPDHGIISYNHAFKLTGCESIERTVRTKGLLWARAVIRIHDRRPPKRLMFEELEYRVRKGGVRRAKEWAAYVEIDIRAFNIQRIPNKTHTARDAHSWTEMVTGKWLKRGSFSFSRSRTRSYRSRAWRTPALEGRKSFLLGISEGYVQVKKS